MAPATKANWKSYEAQARLVRAIVAAHPDVKWNHKEIVACFGSDLTMDALSHRYRKLKAQAKLVSVARSQGFDMKDFGVGDDLPVAQGEVDSKNIAKYFGGSTPDGIQFQFRTIKKEAEELRQIDKSGGDLSSANLASLPTTPRKGIASRTPGSGRSTGTGRKRNFTPSAANSERNLLSSTNDDEETENYSDKDVASGTPTKRMKSASDRVTNSPGFRSNASGQKPGLPSRAAAIKASGAIQNSTSALDTSSSDDNPPPRQSSTSHIPEPNPRADIPIARRSNTEEVAIKLEEPRFKHTSQSLYEAAEY